MKSHIFQVHIVPDELEDGRKAFHATCPALKGCHSWGETQEEALARIREAIELYVDDLRATGEPIPADPARGAIEWPSPSVVVNL